MLKHKILLSLFMLIFTTLVHGKPIRSQEDPSLVKAIEDLRLALLNANKNDLDKIASDKLNYWHSNGNHQDKAAFIEALVSGSSDFVTLAFSEQSISTSGDVAIVHHILSGKTNDGGQPGFVKIGVTLVFQKEANEWKLLARQAFKLPTS